MDERTFQKIAIIVFLVGFLSLFAVYSFSSPDIVFSSDLPEDSLIQFQGTILSITQTSFGSSISLSRSCIEQGFFDIENVSSIPLNSSVTITGRKSGNLFVIESISFR